MFSVLIADDENIIRSGLVESVPWEEHNMQVVASAEDGNEAFDMTEKLRPDIIITDINMPGCDGLEFLQRLRQIPNYSPEMIILTGYGEFEYAKSALELGALSFLLKPVDEVQLFEQLKKAQTKILQNKNYNKILSDYTSKLPELSNVFLTNLFKGKISDTNAINQQFEQYGIEPKAYFCIADIISAPINSTLIKNNISLENCYLCSIHESEHCILIFTDSFCHEDIYNALSELNNNIAKLTGGGLNIGISDFYKENNYYTTAYYEAYEAARTILEQNKQIIFYNSIKSNTKKVIRDALNIITKNFSRQITISDTAYELGVSESQLVHLFKQETGKTFNGYLTDFRINIAKNMLKSGDYRIYEIADTVGYKNIKYFSTVFKKVTGLSPSEYVESIK